MGVLCQYIGSKTAESPNPPFPSVRMAQLFYEFLGRYKDWKYARRQETIGMIIVLLQGFFTVLILLLFPKVEMTVIITMLILFFLTTRKFFEIHELVSHRFVNVNILYHHLIGKLEVGFCDHREPCQCVEDFRRYVFKNYNISFEMGFIC